MPYFIVRDSNYLAPLEIHEFYVPMPTWKNIMIMVMIVVKKYQNFLMFKSYFVKRLNIGWNKKMLVQE